MTGKKPVFVRRGSVVKYVQWEAVPDKYEGPRIFAERADAEAYAEKTYGRVQLVAYFDEGEVRFWTEDAVAGDTVTRVAYQVRQWGEGRSTEYDDFESAAAAVPAGESATVTQQVWIARTGERALGDSIDVQGREVRK